MRKYYINYIKTDRDTFIKELAFSLFDFGNDENNKNLGKTVATSMFEHIKGELENTFKNASLQVKDKNFQSYIDKPNGFDFAKAYKDLKEIEQDIKYMSLEKAFAYLKGEDIIDGWFDFVTDNTITSVTLNKDNFLELFDIRVYDNNNNELYYTNKDNARVSMEQLYEISQSYEEEE